MPYYVHAENVAPAMGTPYTHKAPAFAVAASLTVQKDVKHLATFVIGEIERREWRVREYMRFKDGVYQLPPWVPALYYLWEPADGTDQNYSQYARVAMHFAHHSVKTPGCIAYTPSDELGYQDRQVTVKVGKYLTEFLSDVFNTEQIAAYVATVKSYTAGLQIARSADDIRKVYQNGPNSCMSHDTSDYETEGIHPTAVYADGDIGVAYLGDIVKPSARALVWPDKKLYTRLYGDTTLTRVLESAGYEPADTYGHSYPIFAGAKIKAIKIGKVNGSDRYVMPYLDCARGVELSRDKKTFTILSRQGEWAIWETDGYTYSTDRRVCGNCDSDVDDEDENYCESCRDDMSTCNRCGEDFFGDADGEVIDDSWYCDSCVQRHYTHTCEHCDETWTEVNPDSSYCDECRDEMAGCSECGEMHHTGESKDPDSEKCDECYTEDEEDEDEDETPAPTPAPIVAAPMPPATPVDEDAPWRHCPVPSIEYDTVYVYLVGSAQYRGVDTMHVSGALAVHAGIDYHEYTITHIPTGYRVAGYADLRDAIAVADALTTPGVNWGFTTRDEMSEDTRAFSLCVIRQYRSVSGEPCTR